MTTPGKTRFGRLFWPAVVFGVACAAAAGWQVFGPVPRAEAAKTEQPAPAAKKPVAGQPAAEPKELPIEQRPYRVRVSVAFAGATSLSPAFRQKTLDELRRMIARGYGRMWQAEVVENGWVSPVNGIGLGRLTAEALLLRFPGAKPARITSFDKVFYLTVEAEGPRIRVSGREWDAHSQTIGPLQSVDTRQRREVAQRSLGLLSRLFHPILVVDSFNGWSVELRLRAAGFPAADPALRQMKVGDVILPYFRYADGPKIVRRIQTFDWTYIIVDSVDGAYVTGSLVSAYFRNPLGTGARRRVDILASRVRPRLRSSQLKMVKQNDETRPLVGYNVELVSKRYPRDKPVKPAIKRYSGRDGFVRVDVDDAQPVVWVYVYSGTALLARVPYVPGLKASDTVALPDDSIRLQAEGQLDLLKGRIIDIVARRATLMALAQQAHDDEKLKPAERRKQVAKLFREIDQLDGKADLDNALTGIREPALAKAVRLKNRFAAARIKRMARRVEKLIDRFLKRDDIEKLKKELLFGGKKSP